MYQKANYFPSFFKHETGEGVLKLNHQKAVHGRRRLPFQEV
jgi:hypothetical protein